MSTSSRKETTRSARTGRYYVFTLYALDTTLPLPWGVTRFKVLTAMKDHVLGTAQLTGLQRK
jgi:phosphatidylethanolamine-binding protein (PEBP) family uncharacterized protein